MRRLLFILVGLASLGLSFFFRCLHVNAKRQPLGGFRCPDCGDSFAELPTLDGGRVNPLRSGAERNPDAFVRRAW